MQYGVVHILHHFREFLGLFCFKLLVQDSSFELYLKEFLKILWKYFIYYEKTPDHNWATVALYLYNFFHLSYIFIFGVFCGHFTVAWKKLLQMFNFFWQMTLFFILQWTSTCGPWLSTTTCAIWYWAALIE